ncbi:type VI secretion system-associated protein TagF [Microvirga sp. 0TCS3.31]
MYGKLPSKRDFVACSAPRSFLRVWEPWIQNGLWNSKVHLGDQWKQTYLSAPIWRFWLGAEICSGITVAGAFTPSVDSIGRCFPLTVFVSALKPIGILHPEIDLQNAWFSQLERLLLSALDPRASFEALLQRLEMLERHVDHSVPIPEEEIAMLRDGTMAATATKASLEERQVTARAADYVGTYGMKSVWWTIGWKEHPATTLVSQDMPSPNFFTTLLTGCFDGRVI